MSNLGIPDIQLEENTSQRLPCVILIDASASMSGQPIDELNNGLKILEEELKGDDTASQRVQLMVISFGGDGEVKVLVDWTDAMSFSAPAVTAYGNTPLGGAVRMALSKLDEQKKRYQSNSIAYNRPWIFAITDGEPTDDWEEAAEACIACEREQKHIFFGVGVGNANMDKLAKFSERKPAALSGLKFKELFLWLSSSVRTGSKSAPGTTTQMQNPSSWMSVPA